MGSRVGQFYPKSRRYPSHKHLKSAGLVISLYLAALTLPQSSLAVEPWSPSVVDINAPKTSSTFASSAATAEVKDKTASYQNKNIENALDVGDFARAKSLITSKLNDLPGSKNSFAEAYLRTTLIESLIYLGEIDTANGELKKLKKIMVALNPGGDHGYSAADEIELKARTLDIEAWLLEAGGKPDAAQNVLGEAIANLKELHKSDRETWKLMACLSHSASLKAAGGDYDGAKQLLEEALDSAKGSHSLSPINVADIQEALAAVLYKMGDQNNATMHFSQSLGIKNATGAVLKRYAPGPYWLSPDYRYIEGSPWSKKAFQDGVEHKIIDLGALVVDVAAVRDKNAAKQGVQVLLTVTNRTRQSIEFMGRRPEFLVLTPKTSLARMIDPTALAAQIQKKGDGKAKWIRFWGQGATQSVTTNYIGNMPFYGYGYGGGYPPIMSYGGTLPTVINRGGGMTSVISQVPDPIAEMRAMQKAADVQAAARGKADDIRSKSLGPCDLTPGQMLGGAIFFDAPGLAADSSCLFRVPIGDADFEFQFKNVSNAP